jgi:hypothetical protein
LATQLDTDDFEIFGLSQLDDSSASAAAAGDRALPDLHERAVPLLRHLDNAVATDQPE